MIIIKRVFKKNNSKSNTPQKYSNKYSYLRELYIRKLVVLMQTQSSSQMNIEKNQECIYSE